MTKQKSLSKMTMSELCNEYAQIVDLARYDMALDCKTAWMNVELQSFVAEVKCALEYMLKDSNESIDDVMCDMWLFDDTTETYFARFDIDANKNYVSELNVSNNQYWRFWCDQLTKDDIELVLYMAMIFAEIDKRLAMLSETMSVCVQKNICRRIVMRKLN